MLEILNLSPKERDDAIRKLIVPKPWKHELSIITNHLEGPQYRGLYECDKCKVKVKLTYKEVQEAETDYYECDYRIRFGPCPIPDKIDLDWELAMKMRDEIKGESRVYYRKALREIYYELHPCGLSLEWWLMFHVQLHHYILAALIAKGA